MQLRERIILNSEMADLNSNFNSAVEASVLELDRLGMSRVIRNEKVKAISTLSSGQDLLARLRSFSCQNASCSKPRARNNGRSTDNVQTDWGVDQSTFRLAGHVDRSQSIVLKTIVISMWRVAGHCETLI